MAHTHNPNELLTRKEVAFLFKRERTTVYRWEREGLKFRDGRITAAEVVWFLEQRDAARALGMEVRDFLEKPREVREKLMEAAIRAREAVQHSATLEN